MMHSVVSIIFFVSYYYYLFSLLLDTLSRDCIIQGNWRSFKRLFLKKIGIVLNCYQLLLVFLRQKYNFFIFKILLNPGTLNFVLNSYNIRRKYKFVDDTKYLKSSSFYKRKY